MNLKTKFYAHSSAVVEDGAEIGEGTKIWHNCQIRTGANIGQNCILGKGVFVDSGVKIGDNVKIQNYVSVYHGVTIENGVFVGPHVCFTNDLLPRAVNKDGSPKLVDDWMVSPILIQEGVSLGANSTIRCDITVGAWAMVGAGSVATKDIPSYGLVYGNPAVLHGYVCKCGRKMIKRKENGEGSIFYCQTCDEEINIKG